MWNMCSEGILQIIDGVCQMKIKIERVVKIKNMFLGYGVLDMIYQR